MTNFQNYSLSTFNTTLLNNTGLCTLSTCPLTLDGQDLAHFSYLPSLGGNSLYVAIFAILIVLQLLMGIRYRTIGFCIGMFFGLLCEIIGYAARIMMHSNPFIKSDFIMYLVCLTIGPAFLTASIYLCLSRIIVIYREQDARFKPQMYTYFFVFCDLVSLFLQGAGGGVAATANTASQDSLGKNIMIAGLAFQVASLTFFFLLCLDLMMSFRKLPEEALNADFADLRHTKKFGLFLWSLAAASLFIYIRSIFRVAELSHGFHSKLANSQVTFMILEGAMIVLATTLLTVFHPGVVAGRHTWEAASWSKKTEGSSQKQAVKKQRGWFPYGKARKESSTSSLASIRQEAKSASVTSTY